ncbi:hypothetical protein N5B96_15515 [Acinetobacter johnsonii]|uniref:hypothetical protein n=1 Tax=Acinetobacter johnsonii TaxID=40214 RepID=UPI002448F96C|nr:hypothetical protein [Acinetobacter johnsonii]MDH1070856.1 hypothetical protein [Acinetobacter johnsonii]
MKIKSIEDERDIANAAARVLHNRFIEAACNEKVLYVQNDAVWSKTPNDDPVLIKELSGRNPYLSKKFASRGTYKIKKRNISATNK